MSPDAWRGLLVLREFAELSTHGKTKKAGLKKFDACYGPEGGEYSKHYTISNTRSVGGLSLIPSRPSDFLCVRKDVRGGFADPATWFAQSGNGPVADPDFWGAKMANKLSGYYHLCREIYEANDCASNKVHKRKRFVRRTGKHVLGELNIRADCDLDAEISHGTEYVHLEYEYTDTLGYLRLAVERGGDTILFYPNFHLQK